MKNLLADPSFPLSPEGKSGWPWTEESPTSVYAAGDGWPKITIVTASYNQGEFIEETIRSVLLQNYPNLEYFVIDGGSTDHSVSIIKKYEKYINGWVSEKDKGQSDAINKGILRSSGEIFNWLNSDDYLAPHALFEVATALSGNSYDIASFAVRNFGRERELVTPPSACFSVKKNEARIPNINQPGTFFRMSVIRELGALDPDLHFCMDLEWWLKYLLRHDSDSVFLSEKVVACFREHMSSKTVSQAPAFIRDKLNLYSAILHRKDKRFAPLGNYRFTQDISAIPLSFIQRLFNKEFFDNAVLYYGKRRMKEVLTLLKYIDETSLEKNQRERVRRMRFRARWIPVVLFRMKDA